MVGGGLEERMAQQSGGGGGLRTGWCSRVVGEERGGNDGAAEWWERNVKEMMVYQSGGRVAVGMMEERVVQHCG